MNRARHTEAHSRMAKSSGGPAVASVSGRLQSNRSDAALARIVATLYANDRRKMRSADRTNRAPVELASPLKHRMNAPRWIVARLEGLIDPPHAFSTSRIPVTSGIYWQMIRAIFSKSAAYWMIPLQSSNGARWSADNGELDSRVERRFSQMEPRQHPKCSLRRRRHGFSH